MNKQKTLDAINNKRQDLMYMLQEMQYTDDLVDLGMEIDRFLNEAESMKKQLEACDEY